MLVASGTTLSDDDELTAIIAREEHVPSPNFGGVWGSSQADGHWLVGFHLIQLGGGVERQWFTDNIHRPLLEAVLDVPHLVAIVPEEIAGDAKTPEEMGVSGCWPDYRQRGYPV